MPIKQQRPANQPPRVRQATVQEQHWHKPKAELPPPKKAKLAVHYSEGVGTDPEEGMKRILQRIKQREIETE